MGKNFSFRFTRATTSISAHSLPKAFMMGPTMSAPTATPLNTPFRFSFSFSFFGSVTCTLSPSSTRSVSCA